MDPYYFFSMYHLYVSKMMHKMHLQLQNALHESTKLKCYCDAYQLCLCVTILIRVYSKDCEGHSG